MVFSLAQRRRFAGTKIAWGIEVHTLNRLRFGLRTLLVVVAVTPSRKRTYGLAVDSAYAGGFVSRLGFISAILAFMISCEGCARRVPAELPDFNRIVEIRLQVVEPLPALDKSLEITDLQEIQRVLSSPLKHATNDEQPARYEIIGTIVLVYDDGTEEGILLFLPWGHFKYGTNYFEADLSELKSRFAQMLGPNLKKLAE